MLLSILIVTLLLIVVYRFAIKGKIGNFSTGVGNALFQAHTLVRTSVQNVVEAKKEHRKEAGQGDDGPPELPPWAQSGE
jgi:hypothetical protein